MRVTNKMLENKVNWINRLTDSPEESWTKTDKLRANIGNYHISGAYGGVSLQRMCNESGGVTDIFNRGHMPKRELMALMDAYVIGLQDGGLK